MNIDIDAVVNEVVVAPDVIVFSLKVGGIWFQTNPINYDLIVRLARFASAPASHADVICVGSSLLQHGIQGSEFTRGSNALSRVGNPVLTAMAMISAVLEGWKAHSDDRLKIIPAAIRRQIANPGAVIQAAQSSSQDAPKERRSPAEVNALNQRAAASVQNLHRVMSDGMAGR